MASIAKLAVILTAVTKPLEDGLKGAHSKLSSFSHGIGEAGKLFSGLFIMDSLEKGFKKAIKANEELNENAERCEGAFGKILLSITGMAYWLPKVTGFMEQMAEKFSMEHLAQEAQIYKEKIESIKMAMAGNSEESIRKRVDVMRAEYNQAVMTENVEKRRAALERERFERAREAQWVQMAGTEAQKDYLKELEGTYKTLAMEDPTYKKGWINAILKDAPSSSPAGSIRHMIGEIEKLEEQKKVREELQKLMEDGKQVIESVYSPLEKLAVEQEKYNRMLYAGAINTEAYSRAIKALTPGIKELEELQKETYRLERGELAGKTKEMAMAGVNAQLLKQYEIEYKRMEVLKKVNALQEEAKSLIDSQQPVEAAKRKYAEAVANFKAGQLDAAGLKAFGQALAEARANAQETGPQFAGAATAGSGEAYSAIIRAEKGTINGPLEAQKRAQAALDNQLIEQKKMVKHTGDMKAAFESIKGSAKKLFLIDLNIARGGT